MIKFEDLQNANETIKTTDIKGREYAEVNQRIKAFKMLYPEGFIITELKSVKDGVAICSAKIGFYREDGTEHILGTGTAYEKEGSTFINKTSFIENCETSAVGRALGMSGFGIDVSIASAEEVQNAIANQKKPVKKATAAQKKTIFDAYGKKMPELLKHLGLKNIDDMTAEQAGIVLQKLKESKNEKN